MKITKEEKEWAKAVKDRDGWKCVMDDCEETERINAHHVIEREHEIVRHDVNNGLSLCPRHHSRWGKQLSPHNKSQFFFFAWFIKTYPGRYKYLKNVLF